MHTLTIHIVNVLVLLGGGRVYKHQAATVSPSLSAASPPTLFRLRT